MVNPAETFIAEEFIEGLHQRAEEIATKYGNPRIDSAENALCLWGKDVHAYGNRTVLWFERRDYSRRFTFIFFEHNHQCIEIHLGSNGPNFAVFYPQSQQEPDGALAFIEKSLDLLEATVGDDEETKQRRLDEFYESVETQEWLRDIESKKH